MFEAKHTNYNEAIDKLKTTPEGLFHAALEGHIKVGISDGLNFEELNSGELKQLILRGKNSGYTPSNARYHTIVELTHGNRQEMNILIAEENRKYLAVITAELNEWLASNKNASSNTTLPVDTVQSNQAKPKQIQAKDDDAIAEKSKATLEVFKRSFQKAYPDIEEINTIEINSKSGFNQCIKKLKAAHPTIRSSVIIREAEKSGDTIGKSTVQKYFRGEI